jgi:hypothetical protein
MLRQHCIVAINKKIETAPESEGVWSKNTSLFLLSPTMIRHFVTQSISSNVSIFAQIADDFMNATLARGFLLFR